MRYVNCPVCKIPSWVQTHSKPYFPKIAKSFLRERLTRDDKLCDKCRKTKEVSKYAPYN